MYMVKEKRIFNNGLYFCTLLEFIRRSRNISINNVIKRLSKADIEKELNDAEINHCYTFDEIAYEFCDKYNIPQTHLCDVVSNPSFLSIGYVYKNLVEDVTYKKNEDVVDSIIDVFSSFIIDKISNYESDYFCASSEYLFQSYLSGKMLAD